MPGYKMGTIILLSSVGLASLLHLRVQAQDLWHRTKESFDPPNRMDFLNEYHHRRDTPSADSGERFNLPHGMFHHEYF